MTFPTDIPDFTADLPADPETTPLGGPVSLPDWAAKISAEVVAIATALGVDAEDVYARLVAAEGSLADLGGSTIVYKTADESVTSSTTLQNDDHLVQAILASEKWFFRFTLFVEGDNAGDIKVGLTLPTSPTAVVHAAYGLDSGVTNYGGSLWSVGDKTGTFAVTLAALSGSVLAVHVVGTINNGANAGNIQLQWAQGTSNATATKVLKGSFAEFQKIA